MGVKGWLLRFPSLELLRRNLGERLQDVADRLLVSDTQNLRRERRRRALGTSLDFIQRELPGAPAFSRPLHLLRHALGQVQVAGEGLYLEFGVFRGTTLNWLASLTDHTLYGFDSFEGLPERWRDGFEPGRFRVRRMPAVRRNVRLVPGWFDQSLPAFLAEHPEPVAFLHVDCDLYSSTKCVLDHLGPRLAPGSVIVFDEFLNYPGWEDGESRAFRELVAASRLEFSYLGYCDLGQQVAVRISRNPGIS
jgi:predicted O-methyltransferase YrrM